MIENILVTNTVTKGSVQIDMSTSSYVLVSADFGQIKATHQTYKYPSQIGSSLYSSSLGARTVSIIGYVIGRTKEEIIYRKSVLNTLINPLQTLKIRIEDKYNIDIMPDTTVKYTQTEEENNAYMCKFQISGVAYDPLFYVDSISVQAAGVEPVFHFPLTIPQTGIIMSKRVVSLICRIENVGAVETGLTIKMVAKGNVINPSIVNIQTQEKLTINKTMIAGESIVINTNESKRAIEGTIDGITTNYLRYRSLTDRDWLKVMLGINSFRFAVDSGSDNLDVTFMHQNKYLEVDE